MEVTPETLSTIAPDATALAIRKSLEQVEGALTEFDKISAGLAALETSHPKNLACDVTSPKGMKEAVAGRAAWREPRIAVEKARKAAKAPVLALGRDIDARASYITDRLIEGEANYDDQIKAEEARREAEKQRKAEEEVRRTDAIQRRIACINVPPQVAKSTAAEIANDIAELVARVIGDDFQEFKGHAEAAKDAALVVLRQMHAAAVEREAEAERIKAERAELERLRAEQAERDRAERARIDAEQRAEADRLAADRRVLEQQQALARAEQSRLDAEAAAARRRADEAAAAERAEQDRAARETREAEQRRIDTERAALRREQIEAAEAARREEEAKRAAEAQMRDAAQQMLDALYALSQACDDAEGSTYGSLSTRFVRDVINPAIAQAVRGAPAETLLDDDDVPF